MTGSAIALPLLGAGSASAADATTWDRVAECESGGLWSADLGNGFYGGLQMSQETWESYGGLALAARPDLASRSEQISVAEKVYAATGVKAWETCAPIAGLGGAAETPGADLGIAPTETAPEPSDPARSAEPTDPAGTLEGPTAPATPTDAAAPTDPAGTLLPTDPAPAAPGATGSPAAGAGKHRGEPAPEQTPATDPTAPVEPAAPEGESATKPADSGNSVTGRESDGHASRGDGATRDPGSVEPSAYTVRPGDNLWSIADEHEVPGGWPALYEANQETVGADPDLIVPGQSLDLTGDQP